MDDVDEDKDDDDDKYEEDEDGDAEDLTRICCFGRSSPCSCTFS